MSNVKKYQPFPKIQLLDRQWPSRSIEKAPHWCSVDLRDGNQALITPMSITEKLEFFKALLNIGFKQIEVGFPSASQTEFDFTRKLIDDKLIPQDVVIQVLVQARKHLIEKTFQSLEGSHRPIVHLYNSTSVNQREQVFGKTEQEIIDIALQGVRWIKEEVAKTGLSIQLEYSPESFTGTEPEFSARICNAVIREWGPTQDNKLILNLPATMELSTPNIYADLVEWMISHIENRENTIISIHAHNDRGTAVGASELAMLAGAERVEGTLFGNGERTGNADLIVLALNLYTQGIDPGLNIYNVDHLISLSERINKIPVHCRHPYAGSLVFTAFSGSHQDAINKGLKYRKKNNLEQWQVPYLPIDPSDLGRNYKGIIRINSQSGKGGVAYILEKELGYQIPKEMQQDVSRVVQGIADSSGKEVNVNEITTIFQNAYLSGKGTLSFRACTDIKYLENGQLECIISFDHNGKSVNLEGTGNGPLDACKHALMNYQGIPQFNIISYHEHSIKQGSDSSAIAYIEVETLNNHSKCFGAGIDTNITIAAVKSLFSGLNRCLEER